MSTKGVAVSIAGCRLKIWSSQIFFYRQTSTECPLPALKQLNFWMQISSQLSCFLNSNNDHCDLGFRLTICDVVRRPYRGHEAASEDSMLKRGEGVCGPPMALVERGALLLPESKFFSTVTENPALKRNFFWSFFKFRLTK